MGTVVKKYALLILCLGIVVCCSASSRAGDHTAVVIESQKGSLNISVGGHPFAEFVWQDPEIPRPYFTNLCAPGGIQVSRNYPPDPEKDVADHPHYHPGLWMAFGDISGADFWRNKASIQMVPGSLELLRNGELGGFLAKFQYFDEVPKSESAGLVCEETLACRVIALPEGILLDWVSEFSSEKPFYFGDQEEMGLGVRVATEMRAETSEQKDRGNIDSGNGKIVNAEGLENGAQVWGKASNWCDYRGQVEGKNVGITLLSHPENFRPSWIHARDYGLLVANAFGRKAFRHGEASRVDVKPGDTFRLRYGVFVYTNSDGATPDLDSIYQEYIKLSKAE